MLDAPDEELSPRIGLWPHDPVAIEFPPFQLDVSGWQLRRDGKPPSSSCWLRAPQPARRRLALAAKNGEARSRPSGSRG